MAESKKILIVSGIFPPAIGGPAIFSEAFANFNCKLGNSTTVLCYGSPSEDNKIVDYELKTINLKSNIFFRVLKMIVTLRRYAKDDYLILANGCFLEVGLGTLLVKTRVVAKLPGDVVWERAKNKGRTTSDVFEFQTSRLKLVDLIFRNLCNFSIRRAENVIVPAQYLEKLAISWGVDPTRITLLPNSVNTDLFKPLPVEKKYDLITVSRLIPLKRIEDVIRAAADLDLRLLIVGSGPSGEDLRELSKNLKANVTFVGDKKHHQLPELYSSSRIFVLNSEIEATSYALLEAMACGVPAIASAIGGASELIEDKASGLLLKSPDLDQLKKAISEILRSKHEQQNMSDHALRCSRQYSRDKIFESISRLMYERQSLES